MSDDEGMGEMHEGEENDEDMDDMSNQDKYMDDDYQDEGDGDYDDGDDFHFNRRRSRGGFRGHRGNFFNNRRDDGDWGGPRFGGGGPPRGYSPRGRGYGPGGPPGRGFRGGGGGGGNWRGGRGGFGNRGDGPGWRDDWDNRPPNNWGPGPGFNPNMMGPGPGGMPPMMGGPPQMGMGPPNGPYGPMGYPNNMPPPVDMSGDIWVETKSPDGKCYYYHSRTRETTWTKPEGPTVKIITQDQFEQMAAMGGPMAPMGPMGPMMGPMGPMGPGPMGPNGPMGPMGGPMGPMGGPMGPMGGPMGPMGGPMGPMGGMVPGAGPMGGPMGPMGGPMGPGGPMGQVPAPGGPMPQGGGSAPNGAVPDSLPPKEATPNVTPGQMSAEDDASRSPRQNNKPEPGNLPQFPAFALQHQQQQQQQQQPQQQQPNSFGNFQNMQWGMPGQAPGNAQQQQKVQTPTGVAAPVTTTAVTVTAASTVAKPGQTATPQPAADPQSQIDPEIVARAAEWTEHKAPDGRPYYYKASAGESVWEKPQALKDLETAKLAAAQGISTMPNTATSTPTFTNVFAQQQQQQQQLQQQQIALKQHLKNNAAADSSDSDDDISHRRFEEERVAAAAAAERKRQEDEEARKKKEEEEEKAAEKKKEQDRARPVTSTPVAGTPWCVVWTGDGRVFFYNPSTRTSVWERPEDLVNRSDVDKLVNNPPESVVQAAPAAATANNISATPTKRPEVTEAEDATPAKKMKPEVLPVKEESKSKTQIDIGKEAAIEAEVRAARERAIVPLEQRIKSFREMLSEKEVSAFSTWEKELHKIVFDTRYLLLTSKERKQVFEKYVKERADEERREKRNKMKERKEDFKRLLESANLHGKSSFNEFAAKFAKDDRFRNIEKIRERESLFNEHLLEVRKREKEEKAYRRDQVKKDFVQLLRETAEIDRHTRYGDIKKKLSNDARYKAVDSSSQREDWFREYVKQIKDDRRKDKDVKDREKERDRDSRGERRDKKEAKRDEKKDGEKENNGELTDSEENAEGLGSDEEREKAEKEREKQARMVASLREREKEVQRTLATHLRDRDKEREQHKHDEAVQHFNALLADLIRNSDYSWREGKKILRKDSRWELAELLERDEKEKIFNAHVEQLVSKKREKLRELFAETSQLTLTSSWKDIKKEIKDDPRYTKFSSNERKLEREFKDYIKDKLVAAKADFRELLQETKMVSHNSFRMAAENEAYLAEIEAVLMKDKRYLVLEHIPEERSKLILSFLEDLEKRGPPPPPTASEPLRRNK